MRKQSLSNLFWARLSNETFRDFPRSYSYIISLFLWTRTTVSISIDSREKSRFPPFYFSKSKPQRQVRCFRKTPYFSLRLTVGIAERGKSRFLPQINRTGNTVVWYYHPRRAKIKTSGCDPPRLDRCICRLAAARRRWRQREAQWRMRW